MSYFDTYKSRLKAQGSSAADSTINNTKSVINNAFETSLLSVKVLVDGTETDAIVNQGKLSNFKTLLFRPDTTFNKGNVVKHEGKYYLITDFDTNKVYPVAQLEQCNYSLIYTAEGAADYMKDEDGNLILDEDYRPIPVITSGASVKTPCIVRTSTYKLTDTDQILMPDNQLQVLMQYEASNVFKVNDEKTFWDDTYKVTFVDMTQVDLVSGAGIVIYTFRNVSDEAVS